MEDSEKRLEAKNRSVSDMKGTQHPLHPAAFSLRTDAHRTPIVLVTPLRSSTQHCRPASGKSDDEESLSQGGLEVVRESDVSPSPLFVPGTPSPVRTPFSVAPRPFPLFRESPLVRSNHQHTDPCTPEVIISKTEKNRVLRVVVTPIQKLMAKHTKTSLLRLKLMPSKIAAGTPEKTPDTRVSRNARKAKRKLSAVDLTPTPDPSGSKKAGKAKKESRVSKLKQRLSLTSKNKYNLRTRR